MTVNLSLAEQDRIREALASAATIEERLRGRAPKGTEIVFRALQEAVDILRRLKDSKQSRRPSDLHSAWPGFTLTDEERIAAYFQANVGKEDEGVTIDDPVPITVSPREMAIMDDVFSVFRGLCIGDDVGRDWTLLWMLAGRGEVSGLPPTPAQVGRYIKPRLSARTINQRKDLQCTIIAAKLRFLMVPEGAVRQVA